MPEPVDLLAATDAIVDGAECWQRAEWHLLASAFAERLDDLGVPATADGGRALVAAALFLAEHTPEWGADGRDVLGEIVALGRAMVEHGHRDDEPGDR